ncbi:MAG: glycerate kinase type-2 family protein, partial [Alphaproteobacteria bacterium]
PPHLPTPPVGRTVVVGGGKAAASMASVVEANWEAALEGMVVTRYEHGVACDRIDVVEAAHPVSDKAGQAAAARIMELAHGLGPDDLLLCLISGGGSALLSLPAPGLILEDKQAVSRALLRSGATISEINCVRKHLSAIKGGRLAAAASPARVVSLIISDVPGDDPAVIASGPTVADPTKSQDALSILAKYQIDVPNGVTAHLTSPASETPKPGDASLMNVQNIVVATAKSSLEAAAEIAKEAGYDPRILGDAIEGEARDVGAEQAELAKAVAQSERPVALISGGETTVTVRGTGRGGRNGEYLLALALSLEGDARFSAIAADTDGIDGSENNAGAIFLPETLARARAAGVDPSERLAANDSFGVFESAGDLVVSGPTLTNVNDFRAILIDRD